MKKSIDKNYVSEIDIFLAELRQKFQSPSQKEEYEQYQKIYALRDHANQNEAE
jgi:hypothetical protein